MFMPMFMYCKIDHNDCFLSIKITLFEIFTTIARKNVLEKGKEKEKEKEKK